MPISNDTHEPVPKSNPIGDETRGAVKAELDLIVAAPAFSQSTRCKSFLRHVVLTALTGNTDQLKERIIGIAVFGRPNDFNTGGDSIVRVTANEVRKRLSQYYQESKLAHSVQIDLPRGTYVPEFRIHPAQHAAVDKGTPTTDFSARENDVAESLPETGLVSTVSHPELPDATPSENAVVGVSIKGGARTALVAASFLVLLITAAAIAYGILRGIGTKPAADIWSPFLNAKSPVLLALGTHDISDPSNQASRTKDEFYNVVLHQEIVPIGDVQVLSSIEKLLGKEGISYQLVPAEKVSLTDLQKQPVILIGASGNPWTLRLTQGLRYRISVDWPSGANHPPIASIVDSDEPGGGLWKLDFSVPMDQWKTDYAIIAREDDASIGVPVLVIAGLGNFGTIAASEALTSDALAQKLTHEGPCSGKPNFEAVISTEITGAHAGPPQILRETCW